MEVFPFAWVVFSFLSRNPTPKKRNTDRKAKRCVSRNTRDGFHHFLPLMIVSNMSILYVRYFAEQINVTTCRSFQHFINFNKNDKIHTGHPPPSKHQRRARARDVRKRFWTLKSYTQTPFETTEIYVQFMVKSNHKWIICSLIPSLKV